jgi:hypothetical protein
MDGRDARRWTDDRNVPADFVFCLNTVTENDDQFSLPWTEYMEGLQRAENPTEEYPKVASERR